MCKLLEIDSGLLYRTDGACTSSFAIAEDALECMRRGAGGGGTDATGAGDQTIVVSGES